MSSHPGRTPLIHRWLALVALWIFFALIGGASRWRFSHGFLIAWKMQNDFSRYHWTRSGEKDSGRDRIVSRSKPSI
jgi:hypothetical protein